MFKYSKLPATNKDDRQTTQHLTSKGNLNVLPFGQSCKEI